MRLARHHPQRQRHPLRGAARDCSAGSRRSAPTSCACRKPSARSIDLDAKLHGLKAIQLLRLRREERLQRRRDLYDAQAPDEVGTRLRRARVRRRGPLRRGAVRQALGRSRSTCRRARPARTGRRPSSASSSEFMPHLRSAASASGREFILCGDWNIAHKEIDLRNWRSNQKNSGFLPEERAWLDAAVRRARLRRRASASSTRKPDQYTWWSNRGQAWTKNVGWRIDYQIATPGIAASGAARVDLQDEALLRPRAARSIDYDHDRSRLARRACAPTSSARRSRPVPRHLVGLHLRDDRRDADHAPRAARHHQERGHRLRAHLPRLQLQVPVGAGRRPRAAAAARPLRPAPQLAVAGRRAGDGRGRVSRRRGSGRVAARSSRSPRSPLGVAGATFDIIIDAYRIELLEPRQLGVGLGHVAVRLAHRLGGGRRARAGPRRPRRLDRGLYRVRRVRAAGDAGRRGDGRAGAAPRAGQAARRASRRSSPISARCSSSCGARARWSCCCSC